MYAVPTGFLYLNSGFLTNFADSVRWGAQTRRTKLKAAKEILPSERTKGRPSRAAMCSSSLTWSGCVPVIFHSSETQPQPPALSVNIQNVCVDAIAFVDDVAGMQELTLG